MNTISQRIVQRRKEARYNQKDFAKRIGVSQPSLIKFERGETDIIPLGIAKKMADELLVPFNELFEIEDSQTKKLKDRIESLKQSITDNENDYQKRGEVIDSLLSQLKIVRSYYVDFIIDTCEDWLKGYIDSDEPYDWNMDQISEKVKSDEKLKGIIQRLKKDLQWCLRRGIFSQEDYEGNLTTRIENGLPIIDVLNIPLNNTL